MASCHSANKAATFSPPANFDAGTYINPQKYGYDLIIKPDEPQNPTADTAFVPASFKENLDYSVQRRVNYPSAARKRGIQGKVILELYIDSTGTLTNIETIQSPHTLLTNACKETAIGEEYNSATLGGEPVNSYFRMPFRFRMMRQN